MSVKKRGRPVKHWPKRRNYTPAEGAAMSRQPQIVPVRRMMTPEEASMWLAKNPDNRNMRPVWVRYLAEQIRRGEWHCTTDAIGIDDEGTLRNGQHRLAAIVMADIPCKVLFVEGLPAASFLVTDSGIKRTAADSLKIPTTMAADLMLVGTIMGWSVNSRIPLDKLSNILGWWSPLYDKLGVNLNRGSPGISNASVRMAILLRSAIHSGEEFDYIREQAEAILVNDVQHMSVAVSTAWRRACLLGKSKAGWGDRAARCALIYYCFDPARRDVTPAIRSESAVLEEMQDRLVSLHSQAVMVAENEAARTVTPVIRAAEDRANAAFRRSMSNRVNQPSSPAA